VFAIQPCMGCLSIADSVCNSMCFIAAVCDGCRDSKLEKVEHQVRYVQTPSAELYAAYRQLVTTPVCFTYCMLLRQPWIKRLLPCHRHVCACTQCSNMLLAFQAIVTLLQYLNLQQAAVQQAAAGAGTSGSSTTDAAAAAEQHDSADPANDAQQMPELARSASTASNGSMGLPIDPADPTCEQGEEVVADPDLLSTGGGAAATTGAAATHSTETTRAAPVAHR
jgi:hypothetical protein